MARYACSDLHGRYDLAQLVFANLKDSDELFFLGDAIDRGPQSWDTLQAMLNDPRVTFFFGNHEDFLVKTFSGDPYDWVHIDRYTYYRHEIPEIWLYNGGREMIEKCTDLRERSPEMLQSLIGRLQNSTRKIVFTNTNGKEIILSHAGFTPGSEYWDPDKQIWDRDHLLDRWPDDKEYSNTYIIHGHTFAEYIAENELYKTDKEWADILGPWHYCKGHKIDIDMGSAYSGWTTLLDLNTFDAITIEGDHTYDLR